MNKKRGPYGKSTIKFSVKFFTDKLPEGTDKKTIHLI